MRGDLLNVWDKVWSEVFVKLAKHREAPAELFSELYAALIPLPVAPAAPAEPTQFGADGELIDPEDIASAEAYAAALAAFNAARSHHEEAVNGHPNARRWLRTELPLHITSEPKAIAALEATFERIADISGDTLSNRFFLLVEAFLAKYSLRYDLRRPFSLHPTLPGIFSRLVVGLKQAALADAHLDVMLREFEEALRDLTADQSANRIKICIGKQTNFLEAIGATAPNVIGNTLGAICNQVGTWPHEKVKESAQNLYKFACDYPGIRHGGTPANQIRAVDMRDLIAVCVALVGFSPYLTDRLDIEQVYLIGEAT